MGIFQVNAAKDAMLWQWDAKQDDITKAKAQLPLVKPLDSIAKVITVSLLDLVRPTDAILISNGMPLPLVVPQAIATKDTKQWPLVTWQDMVAKAIMLLLLASTVVDIANAMPQLQLAHMLVNTANVSSQWPLVTLPHNIASAANQWPLVLMLDNGIKAVAQWPLVNMQDKAITVAVVAIAKVITLWLLVPTLVIAVKEL